MPRSTNAASANQGNRGGRGGRGGGSGYRHNFGRGANFYAASAQRARMMAQNGGSAPGTSSGPVNQRALNPLNQYYSDKFFKLKRDADMRGMKNQAFCYKRVINALAKYPMPVLCVEQAQFLEGVGDTVAQRFAQMIGEREKEFEDGLFFGALVSD